MALNLVSIVSQFLTPDTVARIAMALGIDRAAAQKAAEGAIPALLACMGNAAARPGAPQQFNSALESLPDLSPSEMASNIGASGSSLADTGANILSRLFGRNTQQSLGAAVGKFAGLGESKGMSLLGMLAPLALSALKTNSQGTGAGNLVSMLASQKDQFARAIPAGMASLMNAEGLGDALGGHMKSAATAATAPARTAAKTARPHSNWPYLAIAAVVLLAVGVFYFNENRGRQVANLGDMQARVADIETGGLDMTKRVSQSIADLNRTLDGIDDARSAASALPTLQDMSSEIRRINGSVSQMPESSRTQLAQVVNDNLPGLDRRLDDVLNKPGVDGVVGPVVRNLRAQIADLGSTASAAAPQ